LIPGPEESGRFNDGRADIQAVVCCTSLSIAQIKALNSLAIEMITFCFDFPLAKSPQYRVHKRV
jgi:hypothetical protein